MTKPSDAPDNRDILSRLGPERRDFLKKLVGATAFTVPVVASFSMDTLSAYEAHAAVGSNATKDPV